MVEGYNSPGGIKKEIEGEETEPSSEIRHNPAQNELMSWVQFVSRVRNNEGFYRDCKWEESCDDQDGVIDDDSDEE